MIYAKRIDANQNSIVKALRKMGVKVFVTSMVGNGFADLVCEIAGRLILVELKDGSKPPSKRHLTEMEKRFADEWQENYRVVESLDGAHKLVQELRGDG